jgi:hypothetical protein
VADDDVIGAGGLIHCHAMFRNIPHSFRRTASCSGPFPFSFLFPAIPALLRLLLSTTSSVTMWTGTQAREKIER